MSNGTTYYQDLNLHEGASLSEIKSAFRRLAKSYHPDAAGHDKVNVEKFIKVQTAYQRLVERAVSHNQTRRAKAAEKPSEQRAETQKPKAAVNWRFVSSREVGLDVYYSLTVLRPAQGGLKIALPWQAREACPRCLGQGRTLARVGRNSLYRPAACDKCGGTGHINRESSLEVSLTEAMVGQGKVRLRKAGLYNAKSALRGDLTLDINWVDQLPDQN